MLTAHPHLSHLSKLNIDMRGTTAPHVSLETPISSMNSFLLSSLQSSGSLALFYGFWNQLLSSRHSLSLPTHCLTQDFVGLWHFVTAALRKGRTFVQTLPALGLLPFCGMGCVCSPGLLAPTVVPKSPFNIVSCNWEPHPSGWVPLGRTSKVLCPPWLPWSQDALIHPLSLLLTVGAFLSIVALSGSPSALSQPLSTLQVSWAVLRHHPFSTPSSTSGTTHQVFYWDLSHQTRVESNRDSPLLWESLPKKSYEFSSHHSDLFLYP